MQQPPNRCDLSTSNEVGRFDNFIISWIGLLHIWWEDWYSSLVEGVLRSNQNNSFKNKGARTKNQQWSCDNRNKVHRSQYER